MYKTAFIFPGQGSQYVGMLKDLAQDYPIVMASFQEASDILGYNLLNLLLNGPSDKLNQTCKTQPAVLVSSIAIYRLLKQYGIKNPILMAGHSLGEYSALVCGGVLQFADAVKLVELRGKLMQDIVKKENYAMQAIIGLDNALVQQICKENGRNQIVAPASFNSRKQTVIAGNIEAVKRVANVCKIAGAKHIVYLPISVPSHCIIMKPAAEKLATLLKNMHMTKPYIPIINNVDVKIEFDPNIIRDALVRQLYNTVRWQEIIEKMLKININQFIEIGPNKILTGLMKSMSNNIKSLAVNNINSFFIALKTMDVL
ncbi:MAG: ACP S-malonyltransferase [Pantoea sp. Brub]|nr:ACP S-malonyltransferase [Pantoea sp. Brub]